MMNGENGKAYSDSELKQALYEVEDLMDQLLTPWFVGDQAAYCIKQNKLLDGTGIDLYIRDKSLTQYVYDILADKFKFAPDQVKNGFEYKASNNVPIRVKVYTRNYYFFKYPDHVVYNYGTYQLPNPWDTYWKSRFLIR